VTGWDEQVLTLRSHEKVAIGDVSARAAEREPRRSVWLGEEKRARWPRMGARRGVGSGFALAEDNTVPFRRRRGGIGEDEDTDECPEGP